MRSDKGGIAMTTASKITIVRVLLIPVFMVLLELSRDSLAFGVAALLLFILASVTDFVDGYIARKYHQVSDFGKFLDPLADKLLVISAMCVFCQWNIFPAWALMVVLTREFAVTGLRLIAVGKGRVIAAGWSGKVKTASTMVALCVLILFWDAGRLSLPEVLSEVVRWLVIGVIVVTTVYSGIEYFVKNKDVFRP